MKYYQLSIIARRKSPEQSLDLLRRVIKHKIKSGSNTKDGFNDVEKRIIILKRNIYEF